LGDFAGIREGQKGAGRKFVSKESGKDELSINSWFTGLYEDGFYGDVGLRMEVIGFIGFPVFIIDGFHEGHEVDFIKPELLSIPGGLFQCIPGQRKKGDRPIKRPQPEPKRLATKTRRHKEVFLKIFLCVS
jgi:hypothetical protein